ncbi:MAG: VanW family protein [Lachnospiraceae bacterium]|nr:VanW family protein [Lachnospiraceae bacterium]
MRMISAALSVALLFSSAGTLNVRAMSVISTFTTKSDYDAARDTNMSVAASRINGYVLEPGQEFSFSTTILPRRTVNGYVYAETVLKNGRIAGGWGDGICQVSTTLYDALLIAGIPPLERHPHSSPVSYVPEGFDAAISTPGRKDFRFVNTLSHPIVIGASVDKGAVTVNIAKP